MTFGLSLVAFVIALAAATAVLIIHELHIRSLNLRVSNAVLGIPRQSTPFQDMTGWLSSLGMRYRRFYSAENLDQLRTIVQASGFNPHRALSIWIGIKTVSMFLFPIIGLFVAQLSGRSLTDGLIFMLMGVVIGILGPRLILSVLRRRFNASIRLGTPDMIDLLVVCSEVGMGLEGALERVAEEMKETNPAMARVLYSLLDDLRILPNRSEAFEKLGSTSDGLRRFGIMVAQSMQYGTPLSQALRSVAVDLRRERITNLEERAHKLGAKLTIPMVLFMLPAMFVILGGSPFLHLIRTFASFGMK
ncbi:MULTISPECIES: type II secretion system F family protein [unclassified Bradyrhizobium]|uniref:type II secretion system F family protein n=1 Tax=unclassified Bradyrhizobium TaxID=2631580 RepID=UPI001FFB2C22|nr:MULTISPECIES: type II secretion system F family protein [unclassified Bradyrhizobium]MCK1315376.1 type II secretion system F family protein [Bradyrhizobium sp. 23]MCK1331301.1 type II secretion system F family protein [Bradyrhizobium sp. CW9]MCK1504285.1 type II secretion system F family protein [Bradyrhizobium sp. 18]MCK1549554.1 type II secretion system F family protein [Bradyrhizobium sp. 177]MCK1635992.1 type II secretion system F family protein [Bradyrhizobium sp. 162]